MKTLFSLLFLFSCSIIFSQNYETIADGDWNNPLVWNLAAVPGIDVGEVTIHHNMVGETVSVGAESFILDESASLNIDTELNIYALSHLIDGELECSSIVFGASLTSEEIGNLTLNGGASTTGELVFVNLDCIINGEIDAFENTVFGNGTCQNHGSIETNYFNSSLLENYGLISAGALVTTADLVNHSGAVFSCIGQMILNGEITNDGDISTVNLTIGAINVVGDGGRFCIEECLINSADFEGNLDVCDATPSEACDIYFAFSFGEGVSFCSAGECANDVGLSESYRPSIKLYPNPVENTLFVEGFNVRTNDLNLRIIDSTGKLIQEERVIVKSLSSNCQIDTSGLPAGVYQVVLENNEFLISSKVIVFH